MTHNEVRKKYIEFFKKRGHTEIPSSPLVPENDPTTLFNSSGMQPLVSYLLGQPHPSGKRLVNSQKSFRAQDIDEIGDNRHTTFFEMLGNWSLGDYFKKEQLPWIFEFLTSELGLDPKRLYVTVFEGNEFVPKDTESIDIWKDIFSRVGIDAQVGGRIFTYPAKKNWWSRSGEPEHMPPGEPGGPDSEVFFEFTNVQHDKKYGKECHPNCDCGRFMEIANSVFMQYQKQADGTVKELAQKNVDFGGGLERMVAVINDDPDVFKTDLFQPIIKEIERLGQQSYNDERNKRAMRIIADHMKAAAFMAFEGVEPGNKLQGYIMRRLIRRAAVKMHQLQMSRSKTEIGTHICFAVGKIYEGVYFDLSKKDSFPPSAIISEEIERFERTLNKGIKVLEKQEKITGKFAFDLLQTYGFPFELTFELAIERGQKIDKDEFETEFKKHQELSRTAAKGMFKGGLADHSEKTKKLHTATHLLQQSLRDVLGQHVHQKGSNITAERLRFDFSHPTKLTDEQIKKVEELVKKTIKENLPVSMNVIPFSLAVSQGALTVPNTRYPDRVKVYSIGTFSKEVCGGPHVDFTGGLGSFKIMKEEAAGSSCRRIYAILS